MDEAAEEVYRKELRARREAIDEANWQREKERGEEIYRKMQTDLAAAGVR